MKTNITKNKTLLIIGTVALVLIIWIVTDNSKKDAAAKNKTRTEISAEKVAKKGEIKPKEKKSNPVVNNNSKYIKGLLPADVYGNMNMRGFKTEQFLETGMGHTWISKLSKDGFDYEVAAWSENDRKKVQTVKASVICNPPNNILETIPIFQMVSTLPYDNAQPQAAANWVFDNFEENGASTSIGGVKFTIIAKTDYSRMLLMENAD